MATSDSNHQKLPADLGLSGLGLTMQLAGGLFAGVFSMMLAGLILQSMMSSRYGSGGSGVGTFLLIAAISVGRSLYHAHAGKHLLYGDDPLAKVRTYFWVAGAHTVALALIMKASAKAPTEIIVAMAGALLTWPAMLFAITRQQRFTQLPSQLPVTNDKGFEGLAIYMTMLGGVGAIAMGTYFLLMFSAPSRVLQQGPVVMLLLGFAMLLVRSLMHVRAGLRGLRETDMQSTVEAMNQYANFGVISAVVFAAIVFILFKDGLRGSGALIVFAMVGGIGYLLALWPRIVRQYITERQFAALMSAGGHEPDHRRAVDGGLSNLGWLLFGISGIGASTLVMTLLMPGAGRTARDPMFSMFAAGDTSLPLMVGSVAINLVAAVGLLSMAPWHKVAATVYGVGASLLGAYNLLPLLKNNDGWRAIFGSNGASSFSFGILAANLVVPVVTLLLVHRSLTPSARVHIAK